MGGICAMLRELVGTYQVIKGTEYLFTPPREVVGKCPRCGGDVAELQKGFFCQTEACKFAIWKNNKWWAAKKKPPPRWGGRRSTRGAKATPPAVNHRTTGPPCLAGGWGGEGGPPFSRWV